MDVGIRLQCRVGCLALAKPPGGYGADCGDGERGGQGIGPGKLMQQALEVGHLVEAIVGLDGAGEPHPGAKGDAGN